MQMAQTQAVLTALLFLLINLIEGPGGCSTAIPFYFHFNQAYNMVSVEAGHEAVLSCPYISKMSFLLLVTWKRTCSTCCILAYRSDHNETRKLNCSQRVMWKYSPVSDPALRIYPVNLGDEGNYTCEIASSAGNFIFFSSLTVIVPPTVTLTYDKNRVAACQASASKPAADISWVPASNHSSEEEVHHPNGTVTRVSYIGWVNSSFSTVTCLVTHPATNLTLSLDLSYASSLSYLLIGGSASVAAVICVTLCVIFRCRAYQHQLAHGPVGPFAAKNFRSMPSGGKTEDVKPSDFSESIYQNYNPRRNY